MQFDNSRANKDIQELISALEIPSQLNEAALAQEANLIKQISGGNKDALVDFYEKYVDHVYRYLYAKAGNPTEAELLIEETFTTAIKLIMNKNYVWKGEAIGIFLFITANTVLQKRNYDIGNLPLIENMNGLLVPIQSTIYENTRPETQENEEEQVTLWNLVKKLPTAEQQVLIMRHIYRLPYSEVARRLKRGEHASKQLHHRALKRLKQLIQAIDDE
jgi:RNA polymerase sigma-70 factor, ECF subfamily